MLHRHRLKERALHQATVDELICVCSNCHRMLHHKRPAMKPDDLRTISTTPIVLALLILPEKEDEWVTWTHEELMIKGRMYWQSFESAPEIENKSSITVKIPKENYLNSDRLLELLQRVAEEV